MISREEAIEKATDVLEEASKGVCYVTEVDVEWLITAIKALSNERPKGRWDKEIHTGLIGETNEYNDTYFFRCSICGRTVFEKEPYCHCGADMRGEEE